MNELDRIADEIEAKWPDCPRCGSNDTTVVPKTGEWTCQDCGCQWTSDENPTSSDGEDEIPDEIRTLIEGLATIGRGGRDD